MPIDIRITVDASDALRALARLEEDKLRPLIANAVADEDVLPALMKYPPASGKPMRFQSPAQRRAFFAKLRSGAISVPYQRTGRLGRSFQKQPTPQGVDVTSQLAYAPYVRGPGQAAYHSGNWDTLETLASSLEGDAALTATGVIVAEIGGI